MTSGVENQQLRSMRPLMAFVLLLAVISAWGTIARSRYLVSHPPVAAAAGAAAVATTPAAAIAPDAGAVIAASGSTDQDLGGVVIGTAGDSTQTDSGGVVIGTAAPAASTAPAVATSAEQGGVVVASAPPATAPAAATSAVVVSKKKGVVGTPPLGVSVSDESNYVAQAQALAAQAAIEACRKRTASNTACTTKSSLGASLTQVLVPQPPVQGQTRITATPTSYAVTAGAQLGVWWMIAVDTTTGAQLRTCLTNQGTAACTTPNW